MRRMRRSEAESLTRLWGERYRGISGRSHGGRHFADWSACRYGLRRSCLGNSNRSYYLLAFGLRSRRCLEER